MVLNVGRVLFSLLLMGLCFIGREPGLFMMSTAVGGGVHGLPASTAVVAEK